jgi:hypothetical protein
MKQVKKLSVEVFDFLDFVNEIKTAKIAVEILIYFFKPFNINIISMFEIQFNSVKLFIVKLSIILLLFLKLYANLAK